MSNFTSSIQLRPTDWLRCPECGFPSCASAADSRWSSWTIPDTRDYRSTGTFSPAMSASFRPGDVRVFEGAIEQYKHVTKVRDRSYHTACAPLVSSLTLFLPSSVTAQMQEPSRPHASP